MGPRHPNPPKIPSWSIGSALHSRPWMTYLLVFCPYLESHFIQVSHMADPATYARLTSLLRSVFYDEGLVAVPDLTAHKVSEWDSLGNIRLFLEIETEFSLRFSTSEMTSPRNVGELADLIEKKMQIGNE